jgi:hypothetical protein
MAFAEDWEVLGKAERKARLEAAIGETIDRLESTTSSPSDWQKSKILHAIDSTARGLFDVAASNLTQVFAESKLGRTFPNPDTEPGELDAVTITRLRSELDRLKTLPVQDPPDYL